MQVINKGLADDSTRDIILEVNMTPEEAAKIETILQRTGQSFQEWSIGEILKFAFLSLLMRAFYLNPFLFAAISDLIMVLILVEYTVLLPLH